MNKRVIPPVFHYTKRLCTVKLKPFLKAPEESPIKLTKILQNKDHTEATFQCNGY